MFFNGIVVSTESEEKQLGLILTENLSFTKHIYEKMKKADNHIGIIRKLFTYLPFTILNQPLQGHIWTTATSFTTRQQKLQGTVRYSPH